MGDFAGDGNLDLAVSDIAGSVGILIRGGTGYNPLVGDILSDDSSSAGDFVGLPQQRYEWRSRDVDSTGIEVLLR